MQNNMPTTERLAQALSLAGAPKAMIDKATQGYYDDYKSPIAHNIIVLVQDARANGLEDIARRAMDGEFDGTKEEADEWQRSEEGQEVFQAFMKGKRK